MNIDKKTIVIIILSVALAVVSWIAFKSDPVPYDEVLIKKEENRLKRSNDSLVAHIKNEELGKVKDKKKIDSLESLKPIIQKIYVEIDKKINNASATAISSDFKNVFADANIK